MNVSMKSFGSRITPSLVISVLALVVALGGTASASGMIGSPNIKKSAVKSKHIGTKTVKPRHIAKNAVRPRHIKNHSLGVNKLTPAAANALRGQKGDTGAAGEPGAAGVSGYNVVRNHYNFSNSETGSGTATAVCPTGQTALGGGGQMFSGPQAHMTVNGPVMSATGNAPTPGQVPDAWKVSAYKTAAGVAITMTVTVICASAN